MDKINNECIIIGNEVEIDVLALGVIREELCIDTRLIGKIRPSFDIHYIRVEHKSTHFPYLENLVVVAGAVNIALYTVDFKKDSIRLDLSYTTDQPIVGLEVFN